MGAEQIISLWRQKGCGKARPNSVANYVRYQALSSRI